MLTSGAKTKVTTRFLVKNYPYDLPRTVARLAGLLLGRRPGLLEASPALAACSLEAAMLGAAGAGGEAALVARLNLALVLADARRPCDAGLAPALPLIHEVLT